MSEPRGRRSGWAKWGGVAAYLLLTLIAIAAVVGAIEKYDPIPIFVWAVLVYTAYAALVTAGLVVGLAFRPRQSPMRSTTIDGQPARGPAAWPAHWWHDLALDLGLAVLAFVLTGLAFAEGGSLVVFILPVTAVGVWFAGKVGLTATGRRRRDALWLTSTHVIHDTVAGRVRVQRDQVVDVRPVNGWVFVEFDGGPERTISPRPWRPRHRLDPHLLIVNLEDTGTTTDEVVAWLRAELDLDRPRVEPPETVGRRISRWWNGR